MTEKTQYTKQIPGDAGNFGWPVRFDNTRGYVGISQRVGDRIERVLLSPGQFAELVAFVTPKRKAKADA